MDIRRHSLGVVFGLVLAFAVVLAQGGCGKQGSTAPPPGSGDPLYVLTAKEKTGASLERAGKRSEVAVPPEQRLFDGDTVENTGPRSATLTDFKRGHRFTLTPATRVLLNDGKITLFKGGTRLVFKKMDGEFKIVLPDSVSLGIRGTEFILIVDADGRSVVRMLDGTITVDRAGQASTLETPRAAVIGKASEPLQIFDDPASLPADLLTGPDAAALGLGSDTEVIERTRSSTY
ncbi:MAG: hypothetical protein GX442_12875 [Candidatus Riflebacteria bacterium]|nr:hypothetical protein [Candidatus Riflebacteria bacterium]